MFATTPTNIKMCNQILNALPPDEFKKLSSSLIPISMRRGEILYKPGETIRYVYFPENSIVSMVTFFGDGASVETGIIGNEGVTGVSVALSNDKAPRETSVQSAGDGWQIEADIFRAVCEEGGVLQHTVLRYFFAFFEQVAQAGACSHHHMLDQRLARWLLMCDDRTQGREIAITQDFLAQMLGVHRPGVTQAALSLKNNGLIDYKRGVITVINRRGLEAVSCECYAAIKKIYDHYTALLELQTLSYQLATSNERMATELNRQRTLQNVTRRSVLRLRDVVTEIRAERKSLISCSHCQRVRFEEEKWFFIDEERLNMPKNKLPQVTCEDCQTNLTQNLNKTASAPPLPTAKKRKR